MSGARSDSALGWSAANAPSLHDMERMAADAFARLPETFRAQCEDLVICVDDFADDAMLKAVSLDDEFDLLGLFQGVGLPFRSTSDTAAMPNRVWLFRRPILDYWAGHDETLGAIVTHVLVHEIGHHFGLADDDIAAIEEQA